MPLLKLQFDEQALQATEKLAARTQHHLHHEYGIVDMGAVIRDGLKTMSWVVDEQEKEKVILSIPRDLAERILQEYHDNPDIVRLTSYLEG